MLGLQHLISEPTHLLASSLSCIDVIFIDQLNLAVDGVHPFLPPNHHHQIIYCRFNLMMKHSPQYEFYFSDYKSSNQNAIAKALD